MDKLNYTTNYLYEACNNVAIKCVAVLSSYLLQFHFGDLSNNILSALFMLILFDFITGLWGASHQGQELKSSKIFRTAWKLVLYFMMVSAGHFTEVVIGRSLFIEQTIIIFLSVTELISILENVGKAGYEVPINLIKKLQDFIKTK